MPAVEVLNTVRPLAGNDIVVTSVVLLKATLVSSVPLKTLPTTIGITEMFANAAVGSTLTEISNVNYTWRLVISVVSQIL